MRAVRAGALASGIAAVFASASSADSPAATAFDAMLGGCWSAPLQSLPANDTYCASGFENHFVRLRHEVPGPYEMHFGEMLIHHDAATGRLVTRYFAIEGYVIDGDGLPAAGGGADLFFNNDAGEPGSRISWRPASEDRMSYRREQFADVETGWIVNWETSFTLSAPADVLGSFAVEPLRSSQAIEAFGPLVGRCWSAPFEDRNSVDTHCFAPMLGHFVRDRHIVRGDPDYSGETVFHADRDTGQLHFRYFNSIGGVSDGTGEPVDRGIVFGEETYNGNDGVTRRFRGRYSNISEDGYDSVTEELTEAGWEVVSRQRFRPEPDNPFD